MDFAAILASNRSQTRISAARRRAPSRPPPKSGAEVEQEAEHDEDPPDGADTRRSGRRRTRRTAWCRAGRSGRAAGGRTAVEGDVDPVREQPRQEQGEPRERRTEQYDEAATSHAGSSSRWRPRPVRRNRPDRAVPTDRTSLLRPEVLELDGDAEVGVLDRGHHGLQVVALLAAARGPSRPGSGWRRPWGALSLIRRLISLALSEEMPTLIVATWRTVFWVASSTSPYSRPFNETPRLTSFSSSTSAQGGQAVLADGAQRERRARSARSRSWCS